MEAAFFDFINQFGYLAVAGLILFENIFPPIPSELILPLSGFFTTTTDMTLPITIVAATVGSVVGAFLLYGIGRLLSRERLMRFFATRPMRLLGFKPDDVASAVDWFDRKGQITVLICRCVPIVRSLISIPAGTAKMNPARFALYTLVGSAVWNTVLVSLGAAAGSAWATVSAQAEWVSDVVKYVIYAIIAVVVIFWVVKRIVPAIREQRAEH
ncbi:MAG TPA: DedA family protein [Candidatus Olsenella avistercoris]|nr:DedA family protein [Candidatus Olsenella avistercoris]